MDRPNFEKKLIKINEDPKGDFLDIVYTDISNKTTIGKDNIEILVFKNRYVVRDGKIILHSKIQGKVIPPKTTSEKYVFGEGIVDEYY